MPFWRSTRPRDPRSASERKQLLTELLDRNGSWIEVADAKAGAVLAFAVAVIGITVEPVTDAACAVVTNLRQDLSVESIIVAAAFGLLVLFATGSVIETVAAALRTLAPELNRKRDRDGLIFFGDIAARGRSEWERDLERASPDEVVRDLAEQVHSTARIANKKHNSVGKAVHLLIIRAFPFSLLLYVVSHLLA